MKRELTIKIDPNAASPVNRPSEDDQQDEVQIVKAYDLSVPGYLGLPRHFGMKRYGHLKPEDRTAKSAIHKTAFVGVKPIKARGPQQEEFFRGLANICNVRDGFTDFVAVAKTGSGKTVAAITTAIERKKPTLIVVHKNTLKEGWLGNVKLKKGLRFFLGEDFVDDYVGVVQQNTCDYKGKAYVIAMAQTLVRRQYPKEFYEYFGNVMFDELHKLTAAQLSEILKLFPAQVRGGFTATMREDALKKISEWHFGPTRITSAQETPPCTVFECRLKQKVNEGVINEFSKSSMINSLATNEVRNDLLAKIIYHRGVKRKRQIVVISDRVKQLQLLRKKVIALGAKSSSTCLYVGSVYTGKFKCNLTLIRRNGKKERVRLRYGNDKPFPTRALARKAANEYKAKALKEVTPGFKKRKYIDVEIKIDEETFKPSAGSLKRMELRCSVFFTTYGIFAEGNDISRLNMGVEATPRQDQRQPMGRVLRENDGPETEWYGIVDDITVVKKGAFHTEVKIASLLRDATNRRKRYKQQNAKIIVVKDVLRKFGS